MAQIDSMTSDLLSRLSLMEARKFYILRNTVSIHDMDNKIFLGDICDTSDLRNTEVVM